jgi:hypothetical protein
LFPIFCAVVDLNHLIIFFILMNRTVTAHNQNESRTTEIEFGVDYGNVKGERRVGSKNEKSFS